MNYTVIPILGKILKDRGMTQVELSKLTGIPQGTISKFDRNKQHQDVHLVTISKVLGLSIEDLFYIEGQTEFNDFSATSVIDLKAAEPKQPYRIEINLPDQETYNKALIDKVDKVDKVYVDPPYRKASDSNELVSQYLNKQDTSK